MVFEDKDSTLISLCDLVHDEGKRNLDMPLTIKEKRKPVSIKSIESGEDITFVYDGDEISLTLAADDFAMYCIKF